MSQIFWIFWCVILVLIFVNLIRMTKCLQQWNTFSLFLPLYFMHHGLGLPFAVEALERQQSISVPNNTIIACSIGILLSLVFIGFGYIAALRVFPSINPRDETGSQLGLKLPIGGSPISLVALFIAATGITGLRILTSDGVNVLQLLSMSLSYEDYSLGRTAQATDEKIMQYISGLVRYVMLPLIGYVLYHQRHNGALPKIGLWVVGATALFDALATGHKSLVVIFFIGFFVYASLVSRNGKMQWSIVGVSYFLSLLFIVMPLLFMMQYTDFNFIDGIEATLYRIFVEPNRGLLLFFDIFPDQWPFLFGGSSVFVGHLLFGVTTVPPHTTVAEFYGATGSTWNVAFIGDAWADFGYLGIIGEATIIGFWLQAINQWFYSSKRTVIKAAFYVVLIIIAHRFAQVGFLQVIGGFGFVLGWLIFFLATINYQGLSTRSY